MKRLQNALCRLAPLSLLLACGGGASAPVAKAPVAAEDPGYVANDPAAKTKPTEPFAIPPNLRADVQEPETLAAPDLDKWRAVRKLAAVPAAPKSCAFAAASKTVPSPSCGQTPSELMTTLAKSLDGAPETRDARLAQLEACAFPPGFIRALRVEFANAECADLLTDTVIEAPPKGLQAEILHTLVAQSLAARLRRTSLGAPTLAAPYSKDRVAAFVKAELGPWVKKQAEAIQTLAEAGARTAGYGKGIVAIEAGAADLRLAELIKESPVPDEFKKDPELLHAYEGSLDALLRPRLDRGRDGVLVGMRKLAAVGVLSGTRMSYARKLLSDQYAGRRIDALDSLLLPPDTTPPSKDYTLVTVLREAPTFFANGLLTGALANDAGLLSSAYAQGFPRVGRTAADQLLEQSQSLKLTHARGHIQVGLRYWRAVEFDRAITLLKNQVAEPEPRFFVALALALRNGPMDAVDMMRAKTPSELGIGNVEALDLVASEKGPYAGLAAFDAARLLELSPPLGAGRAHFEALANRFTKASELLLGTDKSKALDHAKSVRDIAQALPQ
jgi:hypothetical protein